MIAMGREAHHPRSLNISQRTQPRRKIQRRSKRCAISSRPERARTYALRKQTPEPVFGIIKSVIGFASSCSSPRQGARRVEPHDHGMEHEADIRPGGGELS